MAIYHYTDHALKPVSETTFSAERILERQDLQRLLREQIDVLGERLLVLAEEFGDWIDSARRIDLLCLDTEANLVVVELKRTEDGGHMELQALRYAAMVSKMTFEQAAQAHARHLDRVNPDVDAARASLLQFLGWSAVQGDQFGQAVRIVLVSADFGKELTTTVLWLAEHDIDIRCVRMKPYRMEDGAVLLDVQQIIPLPETAAFQTQIEAKAQEERVSQSERKGLRLLFWEGLLDHARSLTSLHAGRSPTRDMWISASIGRSGFSLVYSIRREDCQVELWIAHGPGQAARNKAAFDALAQQRPVIDAEFGGELEWQRLPDGDGCRIRHVMSGGYRWPVDDWPALHVRMTDAMIRLDRVMRQRVAQLRF